MYSRIASAIFSARTSSPRYPRVSGVVRRRGRVAGSVRRHVAGDSPVPLERQDRLERWIRVARQKAISQPDGLIEATGAAQNVRQTGRRVFRLLGPGVQCFQGRRHQFHGLVSTGPGLIRVAIVVGGPGRAKGQFSGKAKIALMADDQGRAEEPPRQRVPKRACPERLERFGAHRRPRAVVCSGDIKGGIPAGRAYLNREPQH
ncbi:hypothetical protein [Rhodospira trueperi]|uniref:hypothetical protein n=1 Tax=Rhodospira trueperi TaxID=69960 RepID=UPI000B8354ED|nr:hypothetical protein [Rhodospira trueperi]